MRTIRRTPMKKQQRQVGTAIRQAIEVDVKRQRKPKEKAG
jgi:hypothetical protein